MAKFLADMSCDLVADYDGWRARVAQASPLLNTAIEYAEQTNISTEYFPEGNKAGRKFAQADVVKRHIRIGYDTDLTHEELSTRVAHEIKHICQADACSYFSAWFRLRDDVVKSLKCGEYCLERSYKLPSPANSALIHVIAELDAHLYGAAAGLETQNAFSSSNASARTASHSSIDLGYKNFLAEPELLSGWVEKDLERVLTIVSLLVSAKIKFGVSPTFQLVPVSAETLQQATSPFWKEHAYTTPAGTKEGAGDISAIRARIMNDSLCSIVMREFQGLISGNISLALKDRAQALKLV